MFVQCWNMFAQKSKIIAVKQDNFGGFNGINSIDGRQVVEIALRINDPAAGINKTKNVFRPVFANTEDAKQPLRNESFINTYLSLLQQVFLFVK